ncbi:MAG: bifunctional phosphoribosylaminoimidazolecarboxamide formyltransferase/IMP cyclohydrolase [bacterium]
MEENVTSALISVSDKTGLLHFAKELRKFNIKLISSGGTAEYLRKGGVEVTDVAEITKYPSMMDGRLKTLHPLVHGGILAIRSNKKHRQDMEKYGIEPIDMVVVNLYPFESTIANPKVSIEEAIENIDIGGPTMVRAAAKNYRDVAVVVNPANYSMILDELRKTKGKISLPVKERLAVEAFRHTSYYDSVIHGFLNSKFTRDIYPEEKAIAFRKVSELRYGENPHQPASFYKEMPEDPYGIHKAGKLWGKELSFNNYIDLDAAWSIVSYFADPAAVVIKHTNPCGAALADNISEAYKKAFNADPVSAYGGIVGLNRECDDRAANQIGETFIECVIAPSYSNKALDILKEKKNLRIMQFDVPRAGVSKKTFLGSLHPLDMKRVRGGLLMQELDLAELAVPEVKVVTKREPTVDEMEDLFFAWGVAKFVKSNAIVIAKDKVTLGIGAGQMNRVGSTKIAIEGAGDKARGAVLASDGFFPFADSIKAAAEAGVAAFIQPGGSVRDQEVIDEADRHNVAMVITGMRHFRH